MKANINIKDYSDIKIVSTQTALMISDNKGIIKKYISSDHDFIEDEICEFLEGLESSTSHIETLAVGL